MAHSLRGVQSIRTIGAIRENRRVRTPATALLELSSMANEKHLLEQEVARWTRRNADIQVRLAEIAAKSQRLLALVHDADAKGALPPVARPIEGSQRVRTQEFSY